MKAKEKSEARKLRQKGVSVRTIAKRLNVAKSSVSAWVQDIELTPEQVDALKWNQKKQITAWKISAKKRNEQRQAWREEGRAMGRDGDADFKMGCMLYWAEGAKDKNCFTFVNTDPAMMKLMVQWLLKNFPDFEGKMKWGLAIHDPKMEDEALKFWTERAGAKEITVRHIMKHDTRPRKTKKGNRHPMGLLSVRVYSTELQQRVLGAIEGCVNKELFEI